MTTASRRQVLFVKLPRRVVDNLQEVAGSELKLTLGGKERITTGTLHVGRQQHDVRYSGERSGAPALVFESAGAVANGWTAWGWRGRVTGKLTAVQRGRAGDRRARVEPRAVGAAGPSTAAAAEVEDPAEHGVAELALAAAAAERDAAAGATDYETAEKTAPQKKPGIFRQKREMLREKIVHMLAYEPMTEAQILEQIKSPAAAVAEVLGAVAVASKADGTWALRAEGFQALQIEGWAQYSVAARARVASNALRAFDELGLPSDDPARERMRQYQQVAARPKAAPSLTRRLHKEAGRGIRRAAGPAPLAADGRRAGDSEVRQLAASAPSTARALQEASDGEREYARARSRPLQLEGGSTGAAVGRVQERLAAGGAVGRVQERLAAADGRTETRSRSPRVQRRSRGPSLSPVADGPASPSPSPSPILHAETVEDVEQLHQQLLRAYAEYSQLRLRIDSRRAAFEPLATELTAALAELAAQREEAEEGEAPDADELLPGADASTEKCAADGNRLYWADGADAWLADAPDALPGHCVARDGRSCRTQLLAPSHARVLRATRAVVDRYAELDGGDVRRWVRRYLRLHAHIDRAARALSEAHQRVAARLSADADALRPTLGDRRVDELLATAPPANETLLTIALYRDDVATQPPERI
ncbi:hypothetical protein COEREDRAFT_15749 [Coemansia reversa NRRL 1564]|uniref:RNA polymerase II elongation factor ELL N-terminal domain-containing protein n=1 Tax=Coemansia reversa (strain ATCC 12441 / NRRL 1564) TaxID=763665 RepID=A0A2G5BA56_COERN|nr:hypothetical protein COEREDRAFT_15749 [Coemansia reversa NRRL 1564]|eukprot:PIA15895.1 hypothetical protein COEREDRAFT_15749 [Coemansia reversa NRRL 1564]